MTPPPVHLIPALPSQLAALGDFPFVVLVNVDQREVLAAARAAGVTVTRERRTVRLSGSRKLLDIVAAALAATNSLAAEPLRRALHPASHWIVRKHRLALNRPQIMGIVNLTEDSFSGDGVGASVSEALGRASELRRAGATIIDIGGETARADRPAMEAEVEARLVAPAVQAMSREGHIVSIDTYKPLVAQAALEAGAAIVNDISGLTLGTGAAEQAAKFRAGYVLTYSYSVPKRRPDSPPVYADVVEESLAWMFERVAQLRAAGLADVQIAIDPGIAFGKSHDEDLQVLRRLGEFQSLGLPILLAHSRKNFIGSVTGQPPPARDLETHVVSALAYAQGARIFRVHDAEGARRALEIATAMTMARAGEFKPDGESWPWRAGASAAHMTKSASDKTAPRGQRW